MRKHQGERMRMQIGEDVYSAILVVLADVAEGVETWRVFRHAEDVGGEAP